MHRHSDWQLTQVKRLAFYINGYAFSPDEWGDAGSPIVRIQNLTNPVATANRTTTCPPDKFRVDRGDILIPWSGSIGVYQWEGETAWLNQHIFKAIPKTGVDKRFFWWLANYFVPKVAERAHGSTMQHLTKDAFGTFQVFLPPLATQTAIADYLDRKTAAIDALIAKKEQLIEELRKYQEAVIAEAVAPREGWRMLPAKRLFTRRREKNRPEAQLLTASINHGVVPKASLSFKTNEPVHTDLALYQLVRPGDFVISLATFESGLEYAQCEGIISPAYTVVTPVEGLHAEFYRYYLKSSSFIAELYPFRKGIRQGQSISYEDFGSLQIPVPSLAEQERIAERLSKHNAKQSKLMRNLAATLAELKAYRASIIAEAVAGRGNLEQIS